MVSISNLIEAVLACPPERDSFRHGASVHFDVAYEDVTTLQRAEVKSLTWLARYAEGHRFDPLAATTVHDSIILEPKPTDREGGMSADSFLAAVMNQPARKALADLERLTKLLPDNLVTTLRDAEKPRTHGKLHAIIDDLVVDPARSNEVIERWYQSMFEAGTIPAQFLRPQPGPAFDAYVSRLNESPSRPKVWPRDYSEDVVRDVLAFVARGGFTWNELHGRISTRLKIPGWSRSHTVVDSATRTCLRRAKSERRIRWCPYSQQYVARPAWQHRPKHDRRGWKWPRSVTCPPKQPAKTDAPSSDSA
jgi:hypothetical protein